MLLTLRKTDDPDNVVNKTFYGLLNIDVVIKGAFDVNAPVLELYEDNFNINDYSSFTLSGFDRTYSIIDVERLGGLIVRVSGAIDLLDTYKTEIMAGSFDYWGTPRDGDYGTSNLSLSNDKKRLIVQPNESMTIENSHLLSVVRYTNNG